MQANPEQIAEEARHEVETRIQEKDENTPEHLVDVTGLDGILSKIRKDSSTGPDGVRYSDVKALNTEDKAMMPCLKARSPQIGVTVIWPYFQNPTRITPN
jgi:hypothetical protein